MDQKPRNSEAAPFKLPEVQVDPEYDYEGNKKTDEKFMSQAVEKDAAAPTTSVPPLHVTDPLSTGSNQMVDPVSSVPAQSNSRQITVTDDLPANEVDLIEKAWVVKAKAIVAQTKDDPFEQNNEINKIRADYQHKRFKTDLKTDGE